MPSSAAMLAAAAGCAVATAAAPGLVRLADLTPDATLKLLDAWRLRSSFGKLFEEREVDGLKLSLVDTEDAAACESGTWFQAGEDDTATASVAPIMWKTLCALLRQTAEAGGVDAALIQPPARRHLADGSDMDEYSGLVIARDKAMVQLGSDGDITLARTELAELLVMAQQTVFNGDVAINGSLTVNGEEVTGDGIDCTGTFLNCQKAYELGCPGGVYSVFPDGYTGSEPFQVFCPMSLELDGYSKAEGSGFIEPGGWTLVLRYGFADYDNFNSGSNMITHIPTWHSSANWTGNTDLDNADAIISTDPPLDYDQYGAVDFDYWKMLGSEFAVVSNINSWVVCQKDIGDLFTFTEGFINCKNVNDGSTAATYGCEGYAPDELVTTTHGVGLHRANSWYYYFEQESSTNWPVHDPCGMTKTYQDPNQDEPWGAILVRPKSTPCDSAVGPMATCMEYMEAGYPSGSYYISPDGYTKNPMCVYCNMTMDGGGWTLVYRYGWSNYDDFDDASNYVTYIPTWVNEDNWASTSLEALESKVPPVDEESYGAMDFGYWKLLGEEFMVVSNAASWVRCFPSEEENHDAGSLVDMVAGDLQCINVQDSPSAESLGCSGLAPNNLAIKSYGPALMLDSKFYFYWDGEGASNWPVHDSCGVTSTNQEDVAVPYGSIYVRRKRSPCDENVGPMPTCQDYYDAGYPDGSYQIQPDGYYGEPMCVYCDMRDEEGSAGGWTLVYRYGFTNYDDFKDGSNHVTYIPTWTDHSDWGGSDQSSLEGFSSTVPPRQLNEYGAMSYELWTLVATNRQFMVQSNLASWIVCDETDSASLTEPVEGDMTCVNIKDSPSAAEDGCSGFAPDRIQWGTYGPMLKGPTNHYYYWDGEGSTNWPVHDSCGATGLPEQGVTVPYGAVFLR